MGMWRGGVSTKQLKVLDLGIKTVVLSVSGAGQGVNQTEHNLEEKLRNLSIEMHSRLSQLYEDGKENARVMLDEGLANHLNL